MSHLVEVKKGNKKNHDSEIFLPKNLFTSFGLHEGERKAVHFGTKQHFCTLRAHIEEEQEECILSVKAWNALSIPYSMKLRINYHSGKHIFFGPIIGIFTAGFTGSILRPVGERSFLFAKYIHAARSNGTLAVVFGSHHIDWEEGIIEGYYFTDSGWEIVHVPFPDVVYDRLPNRRTEAQPSSVTVKKRFTNEYRIPWFNPGFFDKSVIYKQLVDLPEVNGFLPKTITSPLAKEVKEFIHEYKHVYIKPKNGSLGLGIHQLYYDDKENFYYCRFRDTKQNRLRRYSSLQRLLKTQFPNGLEQLVAQVGIPLLKYQNNPIDFRVHTNKDEQGKWCISAIAAKIAGSGSVTTHVKSGGHVKSVPEIWEDLNLNKSLLEKLRETAILLSVAIDKTTKGNVGEIGFDLGIDQDENIWMFEANSKPGRTIFSHPKLKREDRLTRKMPMSYATYLHEAVIYDLNEVEEITI